MSKPVVLIAEELSPATIEAANPDGTFAILAELAGQTYEAFLSRVLARPSLAHATLTATRGPP